MVTSAPPVTLPTPSSFPGTRPEWLVFATLNEIGYKEDVDFHYQSRQMGGRLQLGGAVVDFLFTNPGGLAINAQGTYWHYGRGLDQVFHDTETREHLQLQGVTLIFIDEDDLEADRTFYVREALQFRDHSRLGRGLF